MAVLTLVAVLGTLGVFGLTDIVVADAGQCAARCYAEEQACSARTKGSPQCSSQLSACLASCRGGR